MLLDRPKPVLLVSLPLAEDIVVALLYQRGALGDVLGFVSAYAIGNWSGCADPRVPETIAASIYLQALKWSAGILGSL